jgi:ribokinase
MVDDEGENRITLVPGANQLLKADEAALGRTVAGQYLLLQCEVPMPKSSSRPGMARAKGATVVLNPAPVCKLPDELWSLVDILVMNEIEAAELAGLPVADPASAATGCVLPAPARTVDGHRDPGQPGRGRRRRHRLPPLCRACGAGWSIPRPRATPSSAPCARARVAGQSMDAAVMRGIQAATLCVTRAGAQASIPLLHELEAVQPVARPSALACP